MPRQVFSFDAPERFVVGTVGQPGERTFYLQARAGSRVVSVALEKQQVSVLAERLDVLLDELLESGIGASEIPPRATSVSDSDPLEAPIVEEFRVGAMALGWDQDSSCVIVEAHSRDDDELDVPELADDSEDGTDTLRVRISGAMARAFAARARAVISAGRPPCPFCALPIEPTGHICPRANGYRRRA